MIYMMMTRLEQLREEKDLKKKEIAKIIGVSDSVYARWENGKEIIPTRRMYQLANYYQVNIDYLLGLTSNRLSIKSRPKIDRRLVATRTAEIRKDFCETLREFASRLHTSNSTWSAYETGKVLILGAFLLEICKMENYSIDWILGRTANKYRKRPKRNLVKTEKIPSIAS